jgi:hypothetical protein
MRQTHIGGEKVFVDFAGDTIDIFDPTDDQVTQALPKIGKPLKEVSLATRASGNPDQPAGRCGFLQKF